MALPASATLRRQIANLLICLSLANLVFIRRWYDLANLQTRALDYFRGGPPPQDHVLLQASVLAALVLALLFRMGWAWVELFPSAERRTFAHCVFLAILMFPLESIRRYWNWQNHRVDWGTNLALGMLEAILAVGIVMRLRGSRRVLEPARTVALVLALFIPIGAMDFGVSDSAGEPDVAFASKEPAAMLPVRPDSPRFLWILFDEFDQRIAFEARPGSVQLPELDRLRAESTVANQVTQTAGDTILAIPSLFSGLPLAKVQVMDASTLVVTAAASGEGHTWRDQPSVFARARKKGVNSELVGWYHPYCRVFADQLVRCASLSSEPTPSLQLQEFTSRQGLGPSVWFLLQMQMESAIGVFQGEASAGWLRAQDRIVQQEQQQQYFKIRDLAYASATDPRVGLAFYHFPTPHPFPIYDRRAGGFQIKSSLDYLDNLALVDRTVGEIRKQLEAEGLWDRTTILITSDHGLRMGMWREGQGWSEEMERVTAGSGTVPRVPFILKIAGDTRAETMDYPFNAVLSADLAMAVLTGEVSTNAGAAAWLKSRAAPEISHRVAP